MKRREYLLTASIAIGAGGCMEHDPVATLHPQSNTGSGPTYASLGTERLITAGSLIGDVPWAYITVSNNTDFDQGHLELSISFYDSTNSLLQQRSHSIAIFPTTTTWTIYDPVTTTNRDTVASVEARIKQAETNLNITIPDTIQVEQSALTADSGTGVTVTGTISTGDYSGQLQLIGLVYDAEDRFRGTVTTTSNQLDTNEQWDFSASNPSIRTPSDQPNVNRCELRIDSITN